MSTTESSSLKISITGVKELLNQGKSRKEIAQHYGLPESVMKEKVWSHPDLKNLKAKKVYDVQLIDDREPSDCSEPCTQEPSTSTPCETPCEGGTVEGSFSSPTEETTTSDFPSTTAQAEEPTSPGHGWSHNGTVQN